MRFEYMLDDLLGRLYLSVRRLFRCCPVDENSYRQLGTRSGDRTLTLTLALPLPLTLTLNLWTRTVTTSWVRAAGTEP